MDTQHSHSHGGSCCHDSQAKGHNEGKAHSCCSGHHAPVTVAIVKDPVCGMSVDPHTAKHRAEHKGQPFKDAETLEQIEVDKTGMLTEGKPAVTAIVPASGFVEDEMLRLVARRQARQRTSTGPSSRRSAQMRGLLAPVHWTREPGRSGSAE